MLPSSKLNYSIPFSEPAKHWCTGDQSQVKGAFSKEFPGICWVVCGSNLTVIRVLTGECLSSHDFTDKTVVQVTEFTWRKNWYLLVELLDSNGGSLCCYCLSSSRVLRAISIPRKVSCMIVIDESLLLGCKDEEYLHSVLKCFSGIAVIGTKQGEILLIDLALRDPTVFSTEKKMSECEEVLRCEGKIEDNLDVSSLKQKHPCLYLHSHQGAPATSLLFIKPTNQVVAGNSTGKLQFWNLQYLNKECEIQLESGLIPLVSLQFQESFPFHVPRCYLWAVSSESSSCWGKSSIRVNLVKLLFRDFNQSSQVRYQGFLHGNVCHTQKLCDGADLNPCVSWCRLLSCRIISGYDRSAWEFTASPQCGVQRNLDYGNLAIFAWEIKKPELLTFVAVFSLQQWLQKEMPEPLKSNNELEGCPYLNLWLLAPRSSHPLPILDTTVFKDLHCSKWNKWNDDMGNGNSIDLLALSAATMFVDGFTFYRFPACRIKPLCVKGFSADFPVEITSSPIGFPTGQPANFCPQEDTLQCLLTRALTNHRIRRIICWMKNLSNEADPDLDNTLCVLSSWVQKMVDHGKKQFLALCFTSCQSHWMYMDHQSLSHVLHLLQFLKNLLTIIQFMRKLPHLVQCPVHWDQEYRTTNQYIFLVRLVHWLGLTGLLPKPTDTCEIKRFSEMWHEMEQSYESFWNKEEEDGLLIHGIVSHLNKIYGPIWSKEEQHSELYPPPNLLAVLKLFLLPCIDTVSLQSTFLYFLLDITHFLRCEDNVLTSFTHTFDVPLGFCQQIKGLWFLDHGHISHITNILQTSLDLLLHPSTMRPWHSWQHSLIIQTLLKEGESLKALHHIHQIQPPIEKPKDLKLYIDVFLHNRCIAEAWALLREIEDPGDDIFKHFLQNCEDLGLYLDLSSLLTLDKKYMTQIKRKKIRTPLSFVQEGSSVDVSQRVPSLKVRGQSPKPFSTWLYSASTCEPMSSEDFFILLKESIREVEETISPNRQNRKAVWPTYLKEEPRESQLQLSLTPQALKHKTLSPSPTVLSSAFNSDLNEPGEDVTVEELMSDKEYPDNLLQRGSIKPSLSQETSTSSPLNNGQLDSPISSQISGCSLLDVSYLLNDSVCEVGLDGNLEYEYKLPPEDLVPGHCDILLSKESRTASFALNSVSKASTSDWSIQECTSWAQPHGIARDGLVTEEGATGLAEDTIQLRERRGSRMNLHPQTYSSDDDQSAFSASDSPAENENFLSLDKAGKETEELGNGTPVEDKTKELSFSQDSFSSSSFASHSFLDLEPLQRATDGLAQKEKMERHRRDSQEAVDQPEILTSCEFTETMQSFFSDYYENSYLDDSEDESQSAPSSPERKVSIGREHFRKTSLLVTESEIKASERFKKIFSLQDTPLFIPPPRTVRQTHPQGSRAFLSFRGSRDPALPHLLSETPTDKCQSGRPHKKEAICFKTTSDRLGHCKLGSWWKQALETRRASSGLLPAIDQFSSTSPDKNASFLSGKPLSCSQGSFFHPIPNQKAEKWEAKQVGKEDVILKKNSCKFTMYKSEKSVGGRHVMQTRRTKRSKKFKRA
ncbi:protein ELYS-like isoform X3 [Lepisosteus oculatus]|uniref:protein ELYS-like isoform X3 n=1 Tax=Lepisosteus oculatus TaxID=7918 RepID=UPI003720665E